MSKATAALSRSFIGEDMSALGGRHEGRSEKEDQFSISVTSASGGPLRVYDCMILPQLCFISLNPACSSVRLCSYQVVRFFLLLPCGKLFTFSICIFCSQGHLYTYFP